MMDEEEEEEESDEDEPYPNFETIILQNSGQQFYNKDF